MPSPLISLANLAGATDRLVLVTGLLSLHSDPVIVAQETWTLNGLAPLRLVLGVGVGGVHEEFLRHGLGVDQQGRRTDGYIKALRLLWGDQRQSLSPRPDLLPPERRSRASTILIIVGGTSESAARRAGRLGDGFFALETSWCALQHLIDVMQDAARRAKRDPTAIPVTCLGSLELEPDDLLPWIELGVSRQ